MKIGKAAARSSGQTDESDVRYRPEDVDHRCTPVLYMKRLWMRSEMVFLKIQDVGRESVNPFCDDAVIVFSKKYLKFPFSRCNLFLFSGFRVPETTWEVWDKWEWTGC
jgi:hypothetical protein